MTKITIDVNDYITEEDKRNIAVNAIRDTFVSQAKENFERLVSNASYEIIAKNLKVVFDGELENILIEQVKKIVSDKGSISHLVFRAPDHWDKEPGNGFKIMQETLSEHRDTLKTKIKERFDEQIQEMSSDYLIDALQDLMVSIVEDRLLRKPDKER